MLLWFEVGDWSVSWFYLIAWIAAIVVVSAAVAIADVAAVVVESVGQFW